MIGFRGVMYCWFVNGGHVKCNSFSLKFFTKILITFSPFQLQAYEPQAEDSNPVRKTKNVSVKAQGGRPLTMKWLLQMSSNLHYLWLL